MIELRIKPVGLSDRGAEIVEHGGPGYAHAGQRPSPDGNSIATFTMIQPPWRAGGLRGCLLYRSARRPLNEKDRLIQKKSQKAILPNRSPNQSPSTDTTYALSRRDRNSLTTSPPCSVTQQTKS